jgi:Prokaryotic Ubiquitin
MATTTLKTEVLLREFYFNGVRIPDPAPAMSVEEVREFLGFFGDDGCFRHSTELCLGTIRRSIWLDHSQLGQVTIPGGGFISGVMQHSDF